MTSRKQDSWIPENTIDSLVKSPSVKKSFNPNYSPVLGYSVENSNLIDIDKKWLIIIIVALVIFLLFALLGGLNFIGMTIGDTLNFMADTVTDLGTQGLNIMDGGVHDVTKFILPVSAQPINNSPQPQPTAASSPVPTTTVPIGNAQTPSQPIMPVTNQPISQPPSQQTSNNIQPSNPPSTLANNWCVVGQTNGHNSCVQVSNSQQCMSGLLFPSLDNCLIPKPPN